VLAGYAFGAERPSLVAGAASPLSASTVGSIELSWNRPRDVGLRPALPGSLNTLTAAFGTDYLDPYHATGGALGVERQMGGWTGHIGVSAERHRPLGKVVAAGPLGGGDFRPVRPVAAGDLLALRLGARRGAGDIAGTSWGGEVTLDAGLFDGEPFARPLANLLWVRPVGEKGADLRVRFAAGAAPGAPPQQLFLIGGLNTLPGYDYRSFVGDVVAAADAELGADLWWPWIRGRLTLAAGYSDLVWFDDPASNGGTGISPTRDWLARTTGGIRPAAGIGVGLFFDILRADVARGLDGGRWQLLLSVHPDLWPIL
jgi:hypothetical protein